VFDKFYRVKSHSGMAPGTGLGLALAKSIVEEVHGGALTLRSQLGRGSTFTVTLPASGTVTWKKTRAKSSGDPSSEPTPATGE
jgi:signal transduction histidine kinase